MAELYFLLLLSVGLCSSENIEPLEDWNETDGIRTQRWYNSSSNSNSSSISSISSSSSDSDYMMATGASELEADADSLTCRQSGLSFNDRLGNDISKSVSHLSINQAFY